jgi:hypothetical protein
MDFEPGIYECVSTVKIRREPKVIDYPTTNKVGELQPGTQREIYSVLTLKDNTSWGRVSSPDAAGVSEWVCIKGLNREFMKFVKATTAPGIGDLGTVLMKLDNLETDLQQVKSKLDELLKR